MASTGRTQGLDGSGVDCQKLDPAFKGDTAGTYNYQKQPLDNASDFVLVEDSKNSAEENRRRLNTFDYRSPEQMAKARRLLWLCVHCGVWSAKLYSLLVFPRVLAKKVYNRLKR